MDMYKRILIPTDGSELSAAAIRHGVKLAKALGASVTVLTVSPPFHPIGVEAVFVPDNAEEWQKDCDTQAERVLGVAREIATTAGVTCESVHVTDDHPYQAIIDTARAKGCEAIVMASHGRRGVAALVLGSETTKVLTHSKIPVLVCR
jgi:nucleotide-binding universal stress UspA family protein